jgi:hypothetical protein
LHFSECVFALFALVFQSLRHRSLARIRIGFDLFECSLVFSPDGFASTQRAFRNLPKRQRFVALQLRVVPIRGLFRELGFQTRDFREEVTRRGTFAFAFDDVVLVGIPLFVRVSLFRFVGL